MRVRVANYFANSHLPIALTFVNQSESSVHRDSGTGCIYIPLPFAFLPSLFPNIRYAHPPKTKHLVASCIYQAQLHLYADALNIKGTINGEEDYRSTGSYSLEW